ncbi:MAG: sugar ABC transporter substrate-binding protein [Anaerolineae bacterium]|nr:sugar ABC transporter substrate-binding protein [Anaerolineae bacterium]
MKMHKRFIVIITLLAAVSLVLAACGGAAAPESGSGEAAGSSGEAAAPSNEAVEIRYALWDSAQQPAYEACAVEFQKGKPNIKVKIEQSGWDDYWSGIQTGMVAGNAPDVFTNHLAKYPEFAAKNQIVDIQPLVERDKVPTDIYIGELAELWTREGKRYGLPKDWDTIAIFYNRKMLADAGIDPKVMEDWTWNPKDGGTFEETIAKLTLDENGNNGLSPDFDKTKVKQYGFIHQGQGSGYGQTQWSFLAASIGFKFQDELWGTKFHYDDPRLAETLAWYAGLMQKGYAPAYPDVKSLGGGAMFQAGKGAMTSEGSWNIANYVKNSDFEIGFGLLPVGSEGRKSMFNGLADSIFVGSKHQEEAWEWIKFMASPACQNIVGGYAVVFPAIQSGVDKALEAHKKNGLDVSAFTTEALDPNGTFLFPVADHASEISTIMTQVEEKIYLGETTDVAAALKAANDEVNALFQ